MQRGVSIKNSQSFFLSSAIFNLQFLISFSHEILKLTASLSDLKMKLSERTVELGFLLLILLAYLGDQIPPLLMSPNRLYQTAQGSSL